MPGRRFSIAAVLLVLLGLVFAGRAAACSCVDRPAEQTMRMADGAVVGVLIEVVPIDEYESEFRYAVVRRYKGGRALTPGRVVAVLSASNGAACGLPTGLERHYGLFLFRRQGDWHGGLCSMASPAELAVAARTARDGSGGRPGAERCSS